MLLANSTHSLRTTATFAEVNYEKALSKALYLNRRADGYIPYISYLGLCRAKIKGMVREPFWFVIRYGLRTMVNN